MYPISMTSPMPVQDLIQMNEGVRAWRSSWSGHRTVIIPPKTDQGYGFTLRHCIIYGTESASSQQQEEKDDEAKRRLGYSSKRAKLQGLEATDTIFVKYVKEGSVSHKAGLNTGDRILSINDVPVTGKSYGQVISLIKSAEDKYLKLDILPKDEDTDQKPYKGSSSSLTEEKRHTTQSRSNSSSIGSANSGSHYRAKRQSYTPSTQTTDNAPLFTGRVGGYVRERARRMSASSVDELADAAEKRHSYGGGGGEIRNRKMKSSTSYTSGLSIHPRDQQARTNNGSNNNSAEYFKHQFMDKRRQFEVRCKENKEGSPGKTYSSLGLFYPNSPNRKDSESAENVTVSSSIYRRPRDNVLHSNDSQENISRSGSRPQGRVIPLEKRSPSRELYQSQEMLGLSPVGYSSPSMSSSSSSSRHSYPDSSPALANQTHSYTPQSNLAGEKVKSEHHLTRHYVPVVSSQSPSLTVSPKMSASVDNLDSRPSQYTSERNLRTNYNTRIYEQPNHSSGSRTFIVKIGDKTIETGGSNGHAGGQMSSSTTVQMPSYGTAFALTKSPMATQLELKPNDVVSNRKKQFENGQSTSSVTVNPTSNRYKTEIRKITSQGKFTSVANRLENYAKATDGKVQIRRMSSSEHYSSPEPTSSGERSERSTPQPQQPPYQEQAPIRIYVSQGTPNTPSSPIVEILPMSVYQDSHPVSPQTQDVVLPKSTLHVPDDMVDGRVISDMDSLCEEQISTKPVFRKPSFLAAVSSTNRYSSSHDHDLSNLDSTPTSSWMGSHTSLSSQNTLISFSSMNSAMMPPTSSDGMALTSTPIKDNIDESPVILRKKSDTTPEEDAVKLQRRTSYLMATARDRDSHKLSLDKSVSPNQSVSEMPGSQNPLFQTTPPKQLSMRKLKSFFGEKTPRILEATERRQDPASPIQEVAKEGTLYCKTDIIDGKRSSDRSWKPVWVELRGHALYLHKDKKEMGTHHPFSFDDQPISIKSSIVDIAYDYSKKKTVKKNVFRLQTYNGCEYLFQTEDAESMMNWIQAIQTNNNPDSDEHGLASADLIIRKTSQYSENQPQATSGSQKTSPQAPPKAPKKMPSISLKSKIPHSPSVKRKKTDGKDESSKPKTLKSKIKSFRKHPLGSHGTAHPDEPEVTGMFGVPLQNCIPSPNNDFVPMIVDLCTKIVEARGLEVTGVYRVPGNTAAVNMMQEELNKGIDNMNVEHDKWCDVNVISSLLKAFFRKLPDPLITTELYEKVINSNHIENPEKRMLKLKFLLHELPEHHFETFKHMAEHLNKVASYGQSNKMDSRNLALMFGPTLIRNNDDDMATIVKDMSDQCKIVESIILHHDWFFSSWDQDSYVPVDEQTEEVNYPTTPAVFKMSGDEDNAVNPKDIVSSIVQAANRKLRGSKGDEIDASLGTTEYKERDIDKEIAKYNMRMKSQAETVRSSPNLISMAASSQDKQMVKVMTRKSDNPADRRMAKSQEIMDTDWDYMDSDRQSQSMYINTRHFSDDSLDKNEEMELSPHGTLSGSYTVSRDTIDRLRKIEEEARLLREKEEQRHRDYRRRKIEKQKQDFHKSQPEDDSENLQNPQSHMWHSSAELYRYGNARTDSPSSTSGYSSSMSSSTTDVQSRLKYLGSSVPDFSSTNPSPYSLVTLQKRFRKEPTTQEQNPGGKYFVIQSVGSSTETTPVTHNKPKSAESAITVTKRTNSMETMLDGTDERSRQTQQQTARVVGKRKDRHRRGVKDSSEHLRHSRGSLNRSNSMRRGSLDSLIDLYDKDGRISTLSSDSEDGSDLLSDLTSTFDQKLQVLVNPKYKLNGSSTKLNKSDGSESVEKDLNAHLKLPPQRPLSQCNKYGLCSSNDMLEKQYRDPSLHRSPSTKLEAKVGIAYRFERNPVTNHESVPSARNAIVTLSPTPAMATEPRTSYMVVNPSPVTMFETQPKSMGFTTSSSLALSLPSSVLKNDRGIMGQESFSVSKLEKSEMNISLSKQGRETQSSSDKSKGLTIAFDMNKGQSSPEVVRRRVDRRSKRRHTVGSTNEIEHFRALAALSQPKVENKKSAWEQLQPVVKDTGNSANKDMLSWLRNERLRGSVPDLSTAATPSVKLS